MRCVADVDERLAVYGLVSVAESDDVYEGNASSPYRDCVEGGVFFLEKRVFFFLLTSSAPAEASGADGEIGALAQRGEELDDSRVGYRYSVVVYPWEKERKGADGGEALRVLMNMEEIG